MSTGGGERDGKRARQGDEGLDAADVELSPAGLEGAGGKKAAAAFGSVAERAKWIPLRLDLTERKLLRLLEAALSVSEYTDKVDVLSYRNKTQRIHAQLKDICAILSGLLVASDYRKGQKLLVDRNFSDNAEFFQAVGVVVYHAPRPHVEPTVPSSLTALVGQGSAEGAAGVDV